METNRHSHSNLLSSSTVPNLQPPIEPTTTSTTANWYNNHHTTSDNSSDDNEDEEHHIHHHHHQYTPSPKRRIIQQGFNGVSTPLNLGHAHITNDTGHKHVNGNNNISFSSPMNKLNDLHLNDSDILLTSIEESVHHHPSSTTDNIVSEIHEREEEDDDDVGNKTILNESDSEDSFDSNFDSINQDIDDIQPNSNHNISPPKYINVRKRHHVETPISNSSSLSSIPNQNHHTPMSICTDDTSMENHNPNQIQIQSQIHNLTSSNSKISFITSDSTPCPPQPKRKKLKFKHNNDNGNSNGNTGKKPILNLSNSRKTSVTNQPSQPYINDDDDNDNNDNEEDGDSRYDIEDLKASTIPISQSTPSNSRASTPPLVQTKTQSSHEIHQFEEYGESINGFKFVKSKSKPKPNITTTTTTKPKYKYNYETPINNNRYYYSQPEVQPQPQPQAQPEPVANSKYHIVGEFPKSSAGMMNESDEDIHIGDKRINDPYLKPIATPIDPKSNLKNDQTDLIRQYYYTAQDKLYLPLSLPYFFSQFTMTKAELLTIINDSTTVQDFYKDVILVHDDPEDDNSDDDKLMDLLKRERVKWHPDKWMKQSQNNALHFDTDVLNGLSKVINSLIIGLE